METEAHIVHVFRGMLFIEITVLPIKQTRVDQQEVVRKWLNYHTEVLIFWCPTKHEAEEVAQKYKETIKRVSPKEYFKNLLK